jgi:uncharacterized membrane protein YkoI
VAIGLTAGVIIAGTSVANAAWDELRDIISLSAGDGHRDDDAHRDDDRYWHDDRYEHGDRYEHDDEYRDDDGRPDEESLTGETAARVIDAALAEHPGATVTRVETDSDGVYEAHVVTTDGRRVTVELDQDFTVTGTEFHDP